MLDVWKTHISSVRSIVNIEVKEKHEIFSNSEDIIPSLNKDRTQ